MQHNLELKKIDWLYRFKKKIISGILIALTLSIVCTMVLIAVILRNRLIEDSKVQTVELSNVIRLSLENLMIMRNPGGIQDALESIGTGNVAVTKAFILDKDARVRYSSTRSEIGTQLDRIRDKSCRGCHTGLVIVPRDTTTIIEADGRDVLRNVSIIYNTKTCQGCHDPLIRINGKLIIDQSLQPTYSLVTTVEIIIAVSGVLCLAFLIPFLSRYLSNGVDTYINEIRSKSSELTLLYHVVESLSKSIAIEELKPVVVEILRELFDPDEIEIILPREEREFGGIIWRRSENKIDRRLVRNDPYHDQIQAWMKGNLTDELISGDRREVIMPIIRGDNRLALIVVRNDKSQFDEFGMGLVKAVGSHIAVAFENAALYHIAITDELTGLFSKRHFWSSMDKKFSLFERYGEKLTILMLDIDDFKKINDTHGHPAGDQVLKEVARCILLSTRDGDLSCRYGGEEFAVILPATDSTAGAIVAERIRAIIDGTVFRHEQIEMRLTVSIGLANCPENAKTIRDMIVEADKALYEAKKTGKNRITLSRARTS